MSKQERIINVRKTKGSFPIFIEFEIDGVWMLSNEDELKRFKTIIKTELWEGKL